MSNEVYNSRSADKFVVRLPEGMRDRIAEVAKNSHRSMNSEIIERLERSLVGEPLPVIERKEVKDVRVHVGDPVWVTLPDGKQVPAIVESFAVNPDDEVYVSAHNVNHGTVTFPYTEIVPF